MSATASVAISTPGANPFATDATPTPFPEEPSSISGGAIAGIVVGALTGIALIGAAWLLILRRRRSNYFEDGYNADGHNADAPKIHYAHEADGIGPQVSEVSAANLKDQNGRPRLHEMQ